MIALRLAKLSSCSKLQLPTKVLILGVRRRTTRPWKPSCPLLAPTLQHCHLHPAQQLLQQTLSWQVLRKKRIKVHDMQDTVPETTEIGDAKAGDLKLAVHL